MLESKLGFLNKKLNKKDMLHQRNKILVLLFITLLSWQCQRVKYNKKKMHTIRKECMVKSQEIIGKKEYWQIYNNINDSINNWIKHKLGLYKYYKSFKVDTILCINSAKNKLITGILLKCVSDECSQDDIIYFNGVKIKSKWYFFDGPSLVLIRKYYQKNIHKPLSWEIMEQIAADQLYRGYLNKDGSINDNFFYDLTSGAWGEANTQAEWDSIYLEIIKENWQKQ